MRLFYIFLLSFYIGNTQTPFYQKKVDSIETIIKNNSDNYSTLVKEINALLKLHQNNNNFDNQLELINTLEQLALKKNDSLELANIYHLKGQNLIYKAGLKDVKVLFEKSISIYKKHNQNNRYYKKIFYNYLNISDLYINSNQYGKSLKYLYKAKEYIIESNKKDDKLLKNYYLNNLAYIYTKTENYVKAITVLKEALSLEQEINDEYSRADIYNSFATIYAKQNENRKALEYFDLAEEIYKKINSNRGLVTIINNRGISYFDLKEYEIAEKEFYRAIQLAKQTDFHAVFSESYHYLGKIYANKGEYTTALDFFNKSIEVSKKIEYNDFVINSMYEKALIFKQTNKHKKAIDHLKNCLQYNSESNNFVPLKKVYKELFLSLKNIDYEESISYFNKYTELSDSINQITKINQTEILKAEFNYLKYKSDIKKKNQELLVSKEKEAAAKSKIIFLITLGIVLLLFFVVVIIRQKKLNNSRKETWAAKEEILALKQEKYDNEISFKNQQITDFAIHISEKNELLEKIKSKIKQLSTSKRQSESLITDLLVFINDDINQNKEKAQFYSEIDNTTDAFEHKLAILYPDLTDKDQKIARLVRLKQTSKQIALQLNITPASVDNYRSNLRKKMNIPKGTTLSKFIKNI
ncbi:tetratricopeptide repeat protein [Pseudofulvibacter geojedonensis]|uniref:Tetratricopeptide repeat protein n=1 Tax=Pseudofulvibacter geojedonensis TaxID=1123758 RepID=A0ABW3HYN6_9FLAO